MTQSNANLGRLADIIDRRMTPLGEDFNTECWGALAAEVAASVGADPCDYFGFSRGVYEAAIRLNAELPASSRNQVMASLTRTLAAAG